MTGPYSVYEENAPRKSAGFGDPRDPRLRILLTAASDVDPAIFDPEYNVPILGVCYGLQELAWRLAPENVIAGSEVRPCWRVWLTESQCANQMKQREYGHADLVPERHGSHVDRLFEGIEGSMQVVCYSQSLPSISHGFLDTTPTIGGIC